MTGATQFAQNFDPSLGGQDGGFLKKLGANIFGGQQAPSTNADNTGEGSSLLPENYSFGDVSQQQGAGGNPFGFNVQGGLGNFSLLNQEQGGTVQKTPGEFDHDTNDMILMAQTENGLVDTGIRQTGGEFVLNPEQAEGLEGAYDNIDKKSPTYDQLLALYKAARFLEEPQFDDDYEA